MAAIAIQQWIWSETDSEHPIDSASLDRVLEVANGDAIAAEVNGGWRVSRSQQILHLTPPVVRESNSDAETR